MEALLLLLDDDLPTAQRALDLKRRAIVLLVRRLCAAFSRGIAWPIEADDVVQDTLIRVADLASRSTLTRDNVDGFFYRTATFIVREHYRRQRRGQSMGDFEPPTSPPDDRFTEGCPKQCLKALKATDAAAARMLVEYYVNDEPEARRGLALRLQTSGGALRVRINGVRQKLRTCTQRCESGGGVHI